MKANFDKLAATRLKGMVSLAKSNGEKPDWILSEYWREMSDYWKTPKAKEKSEKARAARLFDRDGLGPHSHRSGSRSYAKVQDNLVILFYLAFTFTFKNESFHCLRYWFVCIDSK